MQSGGADRINLVQFIILWINLEMCFLEIGVLNVGADVK
jgi:hypothetical protein